MSPAPPPPPDSSTAVRLSLAAQPSHGRLPRLIDGAWWPRSYDLTAELPGLLAGLPPAWGQIGSVTVNGASWSACPGRMLVANQVVRLHLTNHPQAPPTICLLAPGRGRWDLLVVAPDSARREAGRLMDEAARGTIAGDGGGRAA
ncbi:DUF5994 family protein [Streptomyces sp. TRM68416]|uniref:DUF5994 family protein n=1 Tax=Streptomyces sp. TRM68416 TaxID=2758412 RepID=UPI001661D6F3|nr:DUF5994 family protein [Streptomyces sp. TRM68416]MBD0842252.1 hypothetical protein [Streptomyces sp. TRM68416]